jgi:multiple sugar transport system substrate-binding protein
MSEAVVTAGTGMNPSRGAQLSPALWQGAGFSAAEAQAYIDMITGALSDQNAVFDLRLPGFPDYKDALEVAVSKVLANQDSEQNALDEAARSWEATTDRLGRDTQRTLYRQSLGLPG